jgi:hypothetical protein
LGLESLVDALGVVVPLAGGVLPPGKSVCTEGGVLGVSSRDGGSSLGDSKPAVEDIGELRECGILQVTSVLVGSDHVLFVLTEARHPHHQSVSEANS